MRVSIWIPMLLFSAAPAAAQPADRLPIVERAIEYHGGDVYRSSVTDLDVCSKSGCFHVRAQVDGGRYDYTVSGKSGGADVEVRTTNDTVEAWRGGEPVEIAGDGQSQRDFAMARVYFCFLPYRLDDPSVRHHDLGLVDWEGRTLHKVKVTFEAGSSTDAGDEYLYWFDPDSGRVEQFAYSYHTREAGLRFRRAVDHRRVGGILFFDQENFGIEGEGLSVDAIDPAFVDGKMRHVSTVRLENVRVEKLGG